MVKWMQVTEELISGTAPENCKHKIKHSIVEWRFFECTKYIAIPPRKNESVGLAHRRVVRKTLGIIHTLK